MKRYQRRRWIRPGWLSAGLLFAGGCPAMLQRNLDTLLSPGAFESALRLPTSAVAGLLEFWVRALGGF